MKKSLFFSLILLAVGMTVLASCDPTLDLGDRKVKFTAVSKAAPATKTAYGSICDDSYQRINWVKNDVIRIYAPDTNISVENQSMDENQDPTGSTSNASETPWFRTPEVFELNYYYANYEIDQVRDSTPHYSAASLKNAGENGLSWTGSGSATFYAAYPDTTRISANNAKKLRFAVNVPSGNGDPTQGLQTGDSTNVKHMPLLAIQKEVSSGAKVQLDFYPAFSTFEFYFKSADATELTINSLELFVDERDGSTVSNQYLTGYAYYDLNDMSLVNGDPATSFENGSKSLKINTNAAINNSDKEALFTLFTLPCKLSKLSIRVSFTPQNGSLTTKTLKLQNASGWIDFPVGHKARILGLALEGGSKWQLTINDQVLPWIEDEQTTSFKSNIGIKDLTPGGYVVTNPLYIYEDINNNILRSTEPYYEGQPISPDGYYYLNNTKYTENGYYIRLTTKIEGEDDPCLTYQFTPTAPIGGYWQLSPEAVEGSLDYFRITVDDGINGESKRLQGQVMGVPVTIYIRPTAEYLALDNAPVCSCIIKCNMSPSITWDPLYSADSEFQSAHTDGTFSYNKFRIAK